jgi:hypothetical protein
MQVVKIITYIAYITYEEIKHVLTIITNPTQNAASSSDVSIIGIGNEHHPTNVPTPKLNLSIIGPKSPTQT